MVAKSKTSESYDKLFWFISLSLLSVFLIINIVDCALPKLYIILISAALLGVAGFFYFKTESGCLNYQFVNATIIELKKIVWPDKDDTLKTAGVVLLAIFLMSLIMRLFDLLMKGLVGLMINLF